MAKNEKAAKENKTVATVNADNVMETIRKGNLMPSTLHEKVQKELADEKEEKQKRLLKNAICKATYEQRHALLTLRARRREDDITKEKLVRASELLDKLTGICSKPGDNLGKQLDEKELITPTQYKDELQKLETEINKKITDSNKQLNDEIRELNSSEIGCYRYSWYEL